MSLLDDILQEERKILKELGYELNDHCADKKYPESYYKDYPYNLFENMVDQHKGQYGVGSGSELRATTSRPAKMASIRSSSAMTFNILGNQDISLVENNCLEHTPGKYAIAYEWQHETIRSGKRQQPANLDALLVSESGSELIFCEMKMMEWFAKNTSELKTAYKNGKNYPFQELVPQFLKAAEVIEQLNTHAVFEHYDVWQMFKHTLAIYNYMQEKGWDSVNKITLVNVVFEPDDRFLSDDRRIEYQEMKKNEHKGFEAFVFALEEAGLLGDRKPFTVKYLSARDFMDCFMIPAKKRNYLRRYTFEG